eukprot:TRINITY_DN23090_c0_g2_i1.p1 TRINITY_DN23090_c0_g2~~TRINITY_DN23090_c0_g2_i1.p1  ORF type:complete len:889 (+),score=254.26 TRINITY_DN23090_c0_g2_i1:200-2866(+)
MRLLEARRPSSLSHKDLRASIKAGSNKPLQSRARPQSASSGSLVTTTPSTSSSKPGSPSATSLPARARPSSAAGRLQKTTGDVLPGSRLLPQRPASGSAAAAVVARRAPETRQQFFPHPLTQLHNEELDYRGSCLKVQEERNHRGIVCQCRFCLSPRGSWRQDEIQEAVEQALDGLRHPGEQASKEPEDAADLEAFIRSSNGRSNYKSKAKELLASSSCPDLQTDGLPPMAPGSRLGTAPLSGGGGQDSPWEASPRTLKKTSSQPLLKDICWRPVRPATVEQRRRDVALHAKEVQLRRQQLDADFLQRHRQAWADKQAMLQERMQKRLESRQPDRSAEEAAAREQERLEQLRSWVVSMFVTGFARTMREHLVTTCVLRMVADGGEEVERCAALLTSHGSIGYTPEQQPAEAAQRHDASRQPEDDPEAAERWLALLSAQVGDGRTSQMRQLQLQQLCEQVNTFDRTVSSSNTFDRTISSCTFPEDERRRSFGQTDPLMVAPAKSSERSRRRSRLLVEKLRMADDVIHLQRLQHRFAATASAQRGAVCARIFPWLRGHAMAGESCDWSLHMPEIKKEVALRRKAHKKWILLMYCLKFLGMTSLIRFRQTAANRIKSFVRLLVVNNKFVMGVKHSMVSLRTVQRLVRAWLTKVRVKRILVNLLFQQVEDDLIMRRTFRECTKTLQLEKGKLRNLRCAKDRKLAERTIAMTQNRLRSFRSPQTPLDHHCLEQHIEQSRLPRAMLQHCVQSAISCRKTLLQREMSLRADESEKHRRELQCWLDIEVALQMLDPEAHNPAPKPEPPAERRLHFLIERDKVTRIVKGLRQWYEKNKASPTGNGEEARSEGGSVEPGLFVAVETSKRSTAALADDVASTIGNIVCTLMLTDLQPVF